LYQQITIHSEPVPVPMKFLDRINSMFRKKADPEKRSILSRRFIIAISVIYSTLIIAVAVSFHVITHKNADTLRDALIAQNRDLLIKRVQDCADRMKLKNATSPEDIKKEISNCNTESGDLLSVILFTKTNDENYYRIADTIFFRDDLRLNLKRSAVVREQKEINYLKQGILHTAVDPEIYSESGYYWQNVYSPYDLGNRKAVIQYMLSASRTQEVIVNYAESIQGIRTFIIVLTVILVVAVVLISLIFVHNYSLLLRNLSGYMKKAADGDLQVSLNPTEDIELNQLAQSFNTLIDELKDRTEKAAQEAESSPDTEEAGAIFKTGVSLLKENNLDGAIAIFKTLTIVKPNGFGSFFNLGVAYAKKREYDTSIRMFEEARRINPSFEVTEAYIEKVKRLQNPDA
jgi:tetratricopeptide (TPR) repeat protein